MLSVVGIWGFNFAIIKVVYADFHPLAFNALRFAIASTIMALCLKLRGVSFHVDPEDRKAILWLGFVVNTVYQFCFVIGLAHTKAGNAGLLMALTPVFAYLIGVLGKREHFNPIVAGGIVLSLIGVAAIVFAGGSASFGKTWKGDLLVTGSAFCWGWYSSTSKHLLARYGAIRLTVLMMIAGTAFLIPLSIPWIVRQDWTAISSTAWAGFFYSTMLSIVYSYFVWAYALTRIGVARTAVFSSLTPIVALFGGWMLLGETPTWIQAGGVCCALTGVYLVRCE
jgi:drug/metabolite transporter (DMT)-like permease